jgi:hypothetical protein
MHFHAQLCDLGLVLREISDIKLFHFLHAILIKMSARYFAVAGKEHQHVIFLSCNEMLAFQWYYEGYLENVMMFLIR